MPLTIHLSEDRHHLEVELPLGKRSKLDLSPGSLARLLNMLREQQRLEFCQQLMRQAQTDSERRDATAIRNDAISDLWRAAEGRGTSSPAVTRLPPRSPQLRKPQSPLQLHKRRKPADFAVSLADLDLDL